MQSLFQILEQHKCPQLRSFNLSNLAMKHGIEAFCQAIRSNAFVVLEELYLDHCSLTHETLEHLARALMDQPLQFLHTLSLSHNHLNSQNMAVLVSCLQRSILPSLKTLVLCENKIGDAGIQELTNNYKEGVLSQVQVLDLSGNSIGNEGAFVIFDAIRHKQWSAIQDLNLENNKISSVTAAQLRSLLEMENPLEIVRLSDMTKTRSAQPEMKEMPISFQLIDFVATEVYHESETVTTPTASPLCSTNNTTLQNIRQ